MKRQEIWVQVCERQRQKINSYAEQHNVGAGMHFYHISGNARPLAYWIRNLEKTTDYDRHLAIRGYLAIKTYFYLLNNYPEFREKELTTSEGAFPDIQDMGTAQVDDLTFGGSHHYIFRSAERLRPQSSA